MSDIRKILDEINKADLVDLIIEYSDNGFFPLEFFLLKSSYSFNADELINHWDSIYLSAQRENEKDEDRAAEILASGSKLVAEIADRDLNEENAKNIYSKVIDDLHTAAEEDGIGMECDSEWIYLDIADELESSLEK